MKKLYEFICTVIIIFVILALFSTFRKMSIFENIKEKMLELKEINNYYQKQELGFLEDKNMSNEIIYRRYNDIIIKEDSYCKLVFFEGKTYYFNKEYMFFMEDNSDELEDYNITINEFPVDLHKTSNFSLACHVKLKSLTFNNERCYSLTYELNDIIYTQYIRRDDAACIGMSYIEDGKEFWDYYTVEIEEENEEDFSYEAIFGEYDELQDADTKNPYVIRNGLKEYIRFDN